MHLSNVDMGKLIVALIISTDVWPCFRALEFISIVFTSDFRIKIKLNNKDRSKVLCRRKKWFTSSNDSLSL